MQIGVPKEIEDLEFRIGLFPNSVRASTDRDDRGSSANIVATAQDAWDRELVIKIKEPLTNNR